MPKINITQDPNTGIVTGEFFPDNRTLKGFFETEIQNDPEYARYISRAIHDLGEDRFDINGNAYGLALSKSGYSLHPLYEETDDVTTGPLSDFEYYLDQWLQFLLSR